MSKDNTHITIPDNVTRIEGGAFKNNKSVVQVTIPDSVTYIGDEAFMGCTSLRYVNIPEKLESIPLRAFMGCTSLKEVNTAEDLEEIFDECFEGCDLLKKTIEDKKRLKEMLTMNNIAGVINNNTLTCFDDTVCTECVIPDGVTTIAADAFKGCTRLEKVTIPESVEEIELGAFEDCTNLSVINVPEDFTLLDTYDLYNTKWYQQRKDGLVILGTVLLEYNGQEKDITVPAGVTRIVEGVFSGVNWDWALSLPSTVKTIEDGAICGVCEPLISIYDV